MRVLVVDDELSIRETFQAFLEDAGYEVRTAGDFFQAQELLAGCDVVLADIVLPQVDGLEILKQVRQLDEDIPVILLTGEPDVNTAATAVRHGAYDYVAKPVTQKVLLSVVGRAAEKKRLLDEQRRLEAENRAYQGELESMAAARTAELERRNQELATLIEIGRDISATLNLPDILKRVTWRAAQVCEAHRCVVWMLSPDGETLVLGMAQFRDGRTDWEMWRLFQDKHGPIAVSHVPEAQQVILQRRPLFIPDVLALSMPRHWVESLGLKNALLVPLVSKEEVLGLMGLGHVEQGRTFTPGQVDMAMAIGAQAAVAIENARLLETERQQRELAETLREVAGVLSSSLDRERVLQVILEQLERVVAYDNVSVMLTSDEGLEIVAQRGLDVESQQAILPRAHKLEHLQEVLRECRPLIIADTLQDERWWRQASIETARCWMGVPLAARERVIGLLNLGKSQPGFYTAREAELVATFASQAAMAIENARLYVVEQQRALTLADALQRQRDLDRLKDQFIQNVSHELRTPLGIIYGYAELLDSGELGALAPEQGEPIRVIVRRVRALRHLVSNLTAIMELDTRELRQEPVDMVELVRAPLPDFEAAAEQAGLSLHTEIPDSVDLVSAHSTHLRRVLDNLLDNAFKFTPFGGRIGVRLGQEGDEVWLEVSDTGIGIAPEQLEHIFERFYQVDGGMSRRYGGMGLGLALVREVVQVYGGRVEVQSVVGEGSVFRVVLPVAVYAQVNTDSAD